MASRSLMHGLAVALLAVGAVALALRWDLMAMDAPYLALMVTGICLVSLVVGLVMGYLTEDDAGSGHDDRD